MAKLTKNRLIYLFLTILIVFGFTTNGFAGALSSGRIIPSGKVTIYSDNQQVGEYSKEAPLPMQSALTCSGDCAVRMTDLFARIKENTTFSVDETAENRSLYIKDGALFFAMPKLEKPLIITTQSGVVTLQQVLLKAAAQGENILTGYLKVRSDHTELGVIEGGSLIVTTADGQSTIQSGNRLLLMAQSELQSSGSNQSAMGGNPSAGIEQDDDDTTWVQYAIMAGIVTGYAADAATGGSPEKETSPVIPQ